jgi:hypothetical protein
MVRSRARTACRAIVLASLVVCACSSSSKGKPIAECVEYQGALEKCFQRPAGLAQQEALVPKTDADRERLRDVCKQNLERLRTACQ